MRMELNAVEWNTLILFLAYTLGYFPGVLDEGEVSDLFQSAEKLRQRIQASYATHNALDIGTGKTGWDRIAAR
jgi:hypothetical protein